MVERMSDIVELIHQRRREASRALREWEESTRREFMLELLHDNLRSIADDPEDFPEPEEKTPFGIEYWLSG